MTGRVAVAVAVLVAACGGSVPAATSATTTVTTTSVPTPSRELTLPLPPVGAKGPAWVEALVFPYGSGEGALGTSPGGGGRVGPEFGAQLPDGGWLLLDTANLRLARFDADGRFVAPVPLPTELLAGGRYFPYQLPHVLADGTLVATTLAPDATTLLLVEDGVPRLVTAPGMFSVALDDGEALYGFLDGARPARLDPRTGEVEAVDWFRTRAGTRFRFTARDDLVTVELPDAPQPVVLRMRAVYAADSSQPSFAGLEIDSGADGTLHLMLYGHTASLDGGQLGGYVAIAPDGTVSDVEPIRDPFSGLDPGSPGHLGVQPGAATPWLMFVDEDAVRVFSRP